VAALHAAAPVGTVAAERGKLGRESGRGALLAPVAVERKVDRLPARRRRRREVEAAEDRSLIAEAVAREAPDADRDLRLLEDAEQPVNRVGGDAGGLEPELVGVEQRLVVVRPAAGLPRDVVERLVELHRTGAHPARRQIRVLLAEGARGTIGPLHLRRVEVQAHPAADEVRAGTRADAELSAAEAAARDVVRRRDERRRDRGVARQVGAAELHAVQRRVVLIGAESEHGEAVRPALLAGDELHSGKRRGHRGEVAQQVGRDVRVVDWTFRPADVRCRRVPVDALALSAYLDCVEHRADALEPGVRNEDLLVGRPLDLEALGGEAERGERDHVVPLATGKGDREASVLVGARGAPNVAGDRRHGNGDVLDREAVGPRHAAADDVRLLGVKGLGSYGSRQPKEGDGEDDQAGTAHCWQAGSARGKDQYWTALLQIRFTTENSCVGRARTSRGSPKNGKGGPTPKRRTALTHLAGPAG
jgi:hypothetical protein